MNHRPFAAYKGEDPYIFASYAHVDAERVFPLLLALKQDGLNIWYDEGIEPGSSWRAELADAIKGCERLLFVASSTSAASANCQREVEYALSNNKSVSVCYLENAELPNSLEFALGGLQAVVADHYPWETFTEKVSAQLRGERLQTITPHANTAQRSQKATRWLLIGLIAAISLWAGTQWLGQNSPPTTPPTTPDIRPSIENPAKVAVRPIFNASGTEELNWLGEGLANLLRDNLSASAYAVVVSAPSWNNVEKENASEEEIFRAAKAMAVDFIVTGYVIEDQEDLLLSVRVTNLRADVDIMSQSFAALSPQSLVGSSDRITMIAKQSMKIPRETALESLSADFYVENLAAYEAYINGLRQFNDFDYNKAAKSMQVALDIAPDFQQAKFRLANIQATQSQLATAIATLKSIPIDERMSERERVYVQANLAMLEDKQPVAQELLQTYLVSNPYDVEAQHFLAESFYRAYQEDKAIDILQRLTVQEPKNHHVWGALGYMLMSLNKLADARVAIQKYAELAQDKANPWELFGTLELRSNNLEKATEHFDQALTLDSNYTNAKLGLARTKALLGNYSESKALLASIRSDQQEIPRNRIDAAMDLASLIRAEGGAEQVQDQFQDILDLIKEEHRRVSLMWSYIASAALEVDDYKAVSKALEHANDTAPQGGVPTRYLFVRGLMQVDQGQFEELVDTVEAIRSYALPKDNPDRTEHKAIAYLQGIAALLHGDATQSVALMQRAVDLAGYEYAIYQLGLAHALNASGSTTQALESARKAAAERANYLSGEVRLDLEIYRRQARELEISLLEKIGKKQEAEKIRTLVQDTWGGDG